MSSYEVLIRPEWTNEEWDQIDGLRALSYSLHFYFRLLDLGTVWIGIGVLMEKGSFCG